MKRKPQEQKSPPSEIETFRDPRGYWMDQLRKQPSCFNGIIDIRKFRVTVRKINEPKEVLIERLRTLWRSCDNHHHWEPMQYEAKKLGIQLSNDDFGKDRKK